MAALLKRISDFLARVPGLPVLVGVLFVILNFVLRLLPDTWPVALGHAPWVEEVWVNYLSNALNYGGRPPRVELGATTRPDNTVCFWIRDNGSGLTPEEQSRLFTPFTRFDPKSGRGRAKGHGLGLSIVRRIVGKLGGEVGVASEVDHGSVFSFTLPAAAN